MNVGLAENSNEDHLMQVHHLGSGYISLRGRLYQASVPDQMLRAQWAVEWAARRNMIGPGKPLLVVGAGVAGISAALHAIHHSTMTIPVLIVDKNDKPFQLQRGKNTREIDACGYHWPHSCHEMGFIEDGPLPIGRVSAEAAVAVWEERWGLAREERAGQLQILPPQLVGPDWPRRDVSASGEDIWALRLACGKWVEAAVVIDCRGSVKEKAKFNSGNHQSFRFWENDTLLDPHWGLDGQVPRILIAGAGDGGLQDLARAATGMTPTAFLRRLGKLPDWFTQSVIELETDAGRQMQLAGFRAELERKVLDNLHAAYQANVDRLRREDDTLRQRVQPLVRAQFLAESRQEGEIVLAYPGSSFGRCYAASHIAAILLDALAPGVILMPHTRVEAVATHSESTEALDHVGVPSQVTVDRGEGLALLDGAFNLVVNRTGFEKMQNLGNADAENVVSTLPPSSLPMSHLLMPFSHPRWTLSRENPDHGVDGKGPQKAAKA